jgi:Family of unknown function (DUF5683)
MVIKGRKAIRFLQVCFVTLFSISSIKCYAQLSDSVKISAVKPFIADSAKANGIAKPVANITPKTKPLFEPIPKKSGMYSALLPGAGQFYNRQYWKLPIIYVGFGVAAYFIADNLNNYNDFRKAYISSINNPNRTDKYANIYTTDQLKILQSDYEKFLDLSILFTSIGYIGQIMDAVAGAHLRNFDISEDLSMRIDAVGTQHGPGIGLVFCLK